eukprot:scaffold7839_cov2568-Prasinococcus_capsulatus_cf.AAC.1
MAETARPARGGCGLLVATVATTISTLPTGHGCLWLRWRPAGHTSWLSTPVSSGGLVAQERRRRQSLPEPWWSWGPPPTSASPTTAPAAESSHRGSSVGQHRRLRSGPGAHRRSCRALPRRQQLLPHRGHPLTPGTLGRTAGRALGTGRKSATCPIRAGLGCTRVRGWCLRAAHGAPLLAMRARGCTRRACVLSSPHVSWPPDGRSAGPCSGGGQALYWRPALLEGA